MTRYSVEKRTKTYVKGFGFFSFARKYKKQLLLLKKVHKTGEFFGNKIADAVAKSCNDNTEKQEPVEEIIIPPEKRVEILSKY